MKIDRRSRDMTSPGTPYTHTLACVEGNRLVFFIIIIMIYKLQSMRINRECQYKKITFVFSFVEELCPYMGMEY